MHVCRKPQDSVVAVDTIIGNKYDKKAIYRPIKSICLCLRKKPQGYSYIVYPFLCL